MNKTIIIVFLVSAILGLAVIGYLMAVPGLKNQTEKRPQIEIAPQAFDFGEIKYGVIAEHIFKIRNKGNAVLEIKRVATSCACTSAKTSKNEVLPGEEADLLVRYDTKLMGDGPHGKGKQERIIYVKSNDPLHPQVEARVYANVQ